MKKITRNIATLMILTLAGTVAKAQVVEQKVGNNNLIMNQNAVLEIESSNRGLLLPRLALTATDAFAPLTAHVEGMTVYNTATAGTGATAVTPGYYYNDGTQWVRVATGADAKTEPWFVQNTANEATANDDNIYQEGKVAIGFTDADSVSEKQLEVKGDFRTATEVAGRDVAFDTNIEGSGIGLWYNADDIDNPTDMGMIQVHQNSVHLIAQSPTNIGATQIAPGLVEYRTGNWGTTDGVSIHHMDKDQIFLSSGSGTANEDVTNLYVRKGEGILFSHTDENTDVEGQYRFPRNAGTVGQVLAVGTYAASAEYSTLSWQNVDDLVEINEPWKIQNTTDDATANTENIYQQGKVAIGFESTDAVSDKQLEVKGDFKTQIENGGEYVGMETNINGLNAAIMYVSNNDNILSATEYDALSISSFGGSVLSSVSGQYTSTISTAADDTNEADFSLKASRNGVNYSSITGSSSSLMFETRDAGDENTVMDIGTTGVRFRYRDNSTAGNNVGDYTFPRDNGQPGQVLITNGVNPAAETAQLSWADVSDLVKAAMPKFFYMPSVEIPTHNTSTGILLTGTQTIDLYASYTEQFSFTGGVGQARSNNASTIPTIPADELDYFITYFDTDVFQNVAVSTEGVLTYSVKSDAVVTPKTFMNIVFKVRD